MFKLVSITMSETVKRLKSVIIVPKKSSSSKVVNQNVYYSQKLLKFKSWSQLKRTCHNEDKTNKNVSGKRSYCKKKWPSIESLLRHAYYKPLGVHDDWGPLSHKHESMPNDNVRYWHQHRCEVCDNLFEHKHKQRGDQSMNYNKHICNVCGGSGGSRRVHSKNYDRSTANVYKGHESIGIAIHRKTSLEEPKQPKSEDNHRTTGLKNVESPRQD